MDVDGDETDSSGIPIDNMSNRFNGKKLTPFSLGPP